MRIEPSGFKLTAETRNKRETSVLVIGWELIERDPIYRVIEKLGRWSDHRFRVLVIFPAGYIQILTIT